MEMYLWLSFIAYVIFIIIALIQIYFYKIMYFLFNLWSSQYTL